jgi:Fe-S-cluster-containing hydrogenase component 2
MKDMTPYQKNAEGTAVVDQAKCMGCGVCLPACPVDAIACEEIKAVESIPE